MKALLLLGALSLPAQGAETPRLATIKIPGTEEFVRVARDVIDARFGLFPNNAAEAGLFDDAGRTPSYSSAAVAAQSARLVKDMKALAAMPWRTWGVDRQIDFRWVYANAAEAERRLSVEKLYLHRPGEWLEPLANDFIALVTYAPERADLRDRLIEKVPDMVAEMRVVCSSPTARDVTTALGIIDGLAASIQAAPPSGKRDAALYHILDYARALKTLTGLPEYKVVGNADYAWRFKNAELLPWDPWQLLGRAADELDAVDAAMAAFKSEVTPPPAPTPAQKELARGLTREKLLDLYSNIVREDRAALERSRILTIPKEVGPIIARETPDAMVPLTGDGGSMNPPPVFSTSNVGYWNVEHFHEDWPEDKRLGKVLDAQNHRWTGMGPYAVHEGVPGHHLQLSIARLNPDPLRSILGDNVQVEGWALYAEESFWRAGGFGTNAGVSAASYYNMLDSWRFRVRRVIYDVNVETGLWTLQAAADFKHHAKPGEGKVDEDLQRTINWPTQLIGYFAGKIQIQDLKQACRKRWGKGYSDRRFHDELLAVGSVPLVFARAKLLGEPVPGL